MRIKQIIIRTASATPVPAVPQFVIVTVEVDMVMFGRQVAVISYIMSAGLTCLFSLLVNYSMYYKLKKIDMVESLKSIE